MIETSSVFVMSYETIPVKPSGGFTFDILKFPHELIIHLIKFIPLSELPTIARLCKALRSAAEERLWKELWLMEPKVFHDVFPPAVSPMPVADMIRRRDAIRVAARKRIIGILRAGAKRPERFSAVTTINAKTYRFSCHHIVTILHLVQTHLTTLRVQCASRNIEFARWGPYDGFYAKMADFDRGGFPCLTHLDLAPCHNASYGQILRMLSLAPNITFLRIAARDEFQDVATPPDPIEEPWRGLPVLERLRHVVLDFPDDDGLPLMCRQLLEKTPNLEKLLVADIWADLEEDGWSDEEQGESNDQFEYFKTLNTMPLLHYLDWRCGSYYVFERFLRPDRFAHLTVLAVDGNLWAEERERIEAITIPPLPKLETLALRTRHGLRAEIIKCGSDLHEMGDIEETQRIPAATLLELLSVPKLSTILFTHDDDLDMAMSTPSEAWRSAGVRGIQVMRYSHGGDTFVHLRTLTRARLAHRRIDGSPVPLDEVEDDERYVLSEALQWENAIAYNGQYVSAEVLDWAFEAVGGQVWRTGQYAQDGALPSTVWTVLKLWYAERWAGRARTIEELKDITIGSDARDGRSGGFP